MKNKSGFILLPVILIILVVGVISYFIFNKNSTIATIHETTPTPSSISKSETISNWVSYTNSDYGYSIKYPLDWKIEVNCFGGSPQSKIVCLKSPNLKQMQYLG